MISMNNDYQDILSSTPLSQVAINQKAVTQVKTQTLIVFNDAL